MPTSTRKPGVRAIRTALTLISLLACFVFAWVLTFLKPLVSDQRWKSIHATFVRRVLDVLRVDVVVHGSLPSDTGTLVVSNHISWLDPLVISQLSDCTFVAKAQIRHWPLVGRMARAQETLMIDRSAPRAAQQARKDVTTRLTDAKTVVVFPEATTSDGSGVLSFKTALFQSALDAGSVVSPVALCYGQSATERAPYVFVGNTSLLASMFWIAQVDGIVVNVTVLQPIIASTHSDRAALSVAAHCAICESLKQQCHRPDAVS